MRLNNLGMLHSPQHRMEEAGKEYKEALQTDRKLAPKNPWTYRSDARRLNNLEMLHSPQPRMWEARKKYKEALTIDRELTQKNP